MSDTANVLVAPSSGRPTSLAVVARSRIGPVRVGPKGRIVMPVEVRRALGVDEGDELVVLLEDDGVCFVTRDAAFNRLRAAFGEGDRSPLEDLMERRRGEREREAQERKAGGR